ncbi:ABC transporter permease [Maridesulfovibrio sp.]|uniref:ABC transporter permease n=1 Tax=Maridesulfovibrio sp. TaxID=2795000 RepID=UPI002A188752|nr:iron export ABC transporter permease subunit FetB [Maridesulfovibrio sp.]
MGAEFIHISWGQLVAAASMVTVSAALSIFYRLKLEKDLAIGVVRAFVQLLTMGYLLKIIFGLQAALPVIALYALMTVFAVHIIRGRVREKSISYIIPTGMAVMVSFTLVTVIVTRFVIGATPWWEPQYFIPIGGMIAGNAMNALSLSLERFFSELRNRREEVEMQLCHGADYREATEEIFRNALRAGMIPSINALMGVGLVALPGMMTGQILAGADPEEAVRYQIVVMFMMVASTALSSIIVLLLVRRRCFSSSMSLLVRTE